LHAFGAHQLQYAYRLPEILFGFRVSSILLKLPFWLKLRRKFERRRSSMFPEADAHGLQKFIKILQYKFMEAKSSKLENALGTKQRFPETFYCPEFPGQRF